MKPSGLVFIHYGPGPSLGYGWKHGFGCGWLPHIIQRTVVGIWNPLVCFFWGHAELDYSVLTDGDDTRVVCVNCSHVYNPHTG